MLAHGILYKIVEHGNDLLKHYLYGTGTLGDLSCQKNCRDYENDRNGKKRDSRLGYQIFHSEDSAVG
jgi:hypothetical protein